jgi:precorrin-3B methylase
LSRPGGLTIVGTGICAPSQVTSEARAAIQQADIVHYVVPERHVAGLIEEWATEARDMADLYAPDRNRCETYRMMQERIMGDVRAGRDVCAVFYGHPGVFVDPSHPLVAAARAEGYPARMAAGVSAADCLYADLGLDPGAEGIQMYSATDFLLKHRTIDPQVPLVLWQMGFIGAQTGITEPATSQLPVLVNELERWYPPDHQVVLYEAATIPGFRAQTIETTIADLPNTAIRLAMTLVIPATAPAPIDPDMAAQLGVELSSIRNESREL